MGNISSKFSVRINRRLHSIPVVENMSLERAMAEIGYTRSTDSRYRVPLEHTVSQRLRTTSPWSKPHRIRTQPHVHRVHPIMAEQVLENVPDSHRSHPIMAGLLDHQPTRTHARAASANSRHVTRRGIVCSFISELFFRGSFSGALFCGP